MAGGYAAVTFDVDDVWHYLELQVEPGRLTVYISTQTAYRVRRAVWLGAEAAAMGLAVCAGECPPAVLADWCEEQGPEPALWGGRDREFHAPAWLRRAVVPRHWVETEGEES